MSAYISLARIDNWSKNILMLVGVLLAYALSNFTATIPIHTVIYALIGLCLSSSANYVLNESLDAGTDKHHPIKKSRAAVKHTLNPRIILAEYVLLVLAALVLGMLAHKSVFIILCIYIFAAWLYNIPPVRLKDKAYADVVLESANYPIRILLGWMCVFPDLSPPSSIIFTTWAIGAFTMSLKRVAEYRMFKTPQKAAAYRKSYAQYTRHSLTMSGFIYGMLTIFGITILMLKYKVELVLLIPILIGWMGLYFFMGLCQSLEIIYPERLIKKKVFLMLTIFTSILALALLNVDIPEMQGLKKPLIFNAR